MKVKKVVRSLSGAYVLEDFTSSTFFSQSAPRALREEVAVGWL